MVSSTTTFNEEQLAKVKPMESQMYKFATEGFSRKSWRYAFVNSQNIGFHDTHIEEGPQTFINPETWEMPTGPTGLGETGGAGMDLIEIEGEQYPTQRFTQGFTTLTENVERDAANLEENRRKISEGFDFMADKNWFKGMADRNGNTLQKGMFQWLKDNVSSDLTFDCENFDGDSQSDKADLVTDGIQENIIKRYAYGNITGKINDTGRWSVVLGRQKALARLNSYRPADGGTAPRDTYWNRLVVGNSEDNYTHNNVGIETQMLVPDELNTFAPIPNSNKEAPTIDLTSEMGDDELLILPDMSQVREHYWDYRQMPSPRLFDPVPKEGGQTRFDYAWRMQFNYNTQSSNRYNGAIDTVHLQNISALFV